MCWKSFNNKPVLQIAEEDIPVQKVLLKKSYYLHTFKGLFSPIYSDVWDLNKLKKTKIGKLIKIGNGNINEDNWLIYEGFHSCKEITKKLEVGKQVAVYYNREHYMCSFIVYSGEQGKYDYTAIYECIIPKGSQYYVNDDGDYVSDSLIVLKEKNSQLPPSKGRGLP